MAAHPYDAALNDLLVTLGRSLLQYVGESWPWTGPGAGDLGAPLVPLVERQKAHVRRLAELLDARRWPVDAGIYPAEYTDLHYLSLDYLLGLLVQSETAVLRQIEETLRRCEADEEARSLLQDAAADQRDIIERLKQLSATPRPESTRLVG